MDQNLLALFRPTRSFEILTKTAIDEDGRTSPNIQFLYNLRNMQPIDRSKMTCPSTPHYVDLEVIFPDNVVMEPRDIVLRPTRFVNGDHAEIKYSATIRNRHPPCLGKEPYRVEVDTEQRYHPDGRIDSTTIRVVVLDPTLDKEKVDLTRRAWGGKVESEHDERKGEQSRSPSPQRSSCQYCANGEVTAIYFDFDLTLHIYQFCTL